MIVTGMEMQKGCGGCFMSKNDFCTKWVEVERCNFNKKRSKDCPLKSVEVLIEKIEREYPHNQCTDVLSGYAEAIEDVLKIIEEYCGMEEKDG